jgi:recombinational DNA repair protein (RecF pathway)
MTSHPRPCLGCGALVNATRCAGCQREKESTRVRPHYGGQYAARARKVREGAVVCWLCGDVARAGDPWQADHVLPGEADSPLLPAHRSCNIRRAHGLPPGTNRR